MPVAKTRRSSVEVRSILCDRLAGRGAEIEAAALTRVGAIADSSTASDPSYLDGLRAAVAAAIEYGLEAVERGEEHSPPVPITLLGQARMAARSGVSLDTVLRRYFAGYSLFGYFMVEEATRDGLMESTELQHQLGAQAVIFDRLLRAVSEEHRRESEALCTSSERRKVERIERLLAGELLDTAGINYDFDGRHLGLIASGAGIEASIRELARALDLRALIAVHDDRRTVWAWLGSRRRADPQGAVGYAAGNLPEGCSLAIGEPGEGLTGWRLTHRQAAAALPIAQRRREAIVRYADVALLASVLQDELLSRSLRLLYLDPLDRDRHDGDRAKETLRAYFRADRNVSKAAVALGESRNTFSSRLRAIEARVGRPLRDCATELDVALQLDDLGRNDPHGSIGKLP